MVGLTIRLFTDEDVDARLAPALRQRMAGRHALPFIDAPDAGRYPATMRW